jgi:hypothetical protein
MTGVVVLPPGLESIEGIEAVLYALETCFKQNLPTYITNVKEEWDLISDCSFDLPIPDDSSYRIINSEEALPDEVASFPFVLIMGLLDRPEDEAMENDEGDNYWHDIVVRVWVKGDVASTVSLQTFRYAEAIKRCLKSFANGAYDDTGTVQIIAWRIQNLGASYSSTSQISPFFQICDITCSISVFRAWA